MGNCVRKGSVAPHWTDDEWESPHAGTELSMDDEKKLLLKLQMERQKMLLDYNNSSNSLLIKKTSPVQVKIKITKRELEELMAGGDRGLATALKAALGGNKLEDGRNNINNATWRPSLDSIQEVD